MRRVGHVNRVGKAEKCRLYYYFYRKIRKLKTPRGTKAQVGNIIKMDENSIREMGSDKVTEDSIQSRALLSTMIINSEDPQKVVNILTRLQATYLFKYSSVQLLTILEEGHKSVLSSALTIMSRLLQMLRFTMHDHENIAFNYEYAVVNIDKDHVTEI